MPEIPHDGCFDSSLSLLADPYGFIGKRCAALGTKLFRTRLLLQENICIMGRDAAAMFNDQRHFTRKNAVLKRIASTLTGVGGVQGMDGEEHLHRKKMFTDIITPEEALRLADLATEELRSAARRWTKLPAFSFYDESREVICRAVCRWAGVPVAESEYARLTYDLAAMYERVDSLFVKYWQARMIRAQRERWMAKLVEEVRAGQIKPPPASALVQIATHRDHRDQLLDPRIAAVELLNVLRPVEAVAVFLAFAALAMHQHPDSYDKFVAGGDYPECFAQEVRRYYPFFPAVAARVRDDFQWRDYHFPRGTRVILGLHATDHDPDFWEAPGEFRPERFRDWTNDPCAFIPQGGGERETDHRCPGDRISVELIKSTMKVMCEEMRFDVPRQDFSLRMKKLPALPRDRFVIQNVRI